MKYGVNLLGILLLTLLLLSVESLDSKKQQIDISEDYGNVERIGEGPFEGFNFMQGALEWLVSWGSNPNESSGTESPGDSSQDPRTQESFDGSEPAPQPSQTSSKPLKSKSSVQEHHLKDGLDMPSSSFSSLTLGLNESNPELIKQCKNFDISTQGLNISLNERDQDRANWVQLEYFKERFRLYSPVFRTFFSDSSSRKVSELVKELFKDLPLYYTLLSFFIFFTVLYIMTCFGCTFRRNMKAKRKRKLLFKFESDLLVFISFVTLVFSIVWLAYVIVENNTYQPFLCALAEGLVGLTEGDQGGDQGVFMGLSKMKKYLNGSNQAMAQIQSSIQAMKELPMEDLTLKTQYLGGNYTKLTQYFEAINYAYPGAKTPNKEVIPNYAIYFGNNLKTTYHLEILKLQQTAESILTLNEQTFEMEGNLTANFTKDIQVFNEVVNNVINKTESTYNSAVHGTKNNHMVRVKKAVFAFAFIVVISIVLISIGLYILMYLKVTDRNHRILFLTKTIFSSYFLLISLGLFLVCSGNYFVNLTTYHGCEFFQGLLNKQDYWKKTVPKFFPHVEVVNNFVNECINRNGSNIATPNMTSSQEEFIQKLDMAASKTASVNQHLKEFIKPFSGPIIGGVTSNKLSKLVSFEDMQTDNPSEECIAQNIQVVNSHHCAKDQVSSYQCSQGFTASTPQDAANAHLGDMYCILDTALPTRHNYEGRYTKYGPVTCDPSITPADANVALTNLLKSTRVYSTKIKQLNSDFNTVYAPEKALFQSMKAMHDKLLEVTQNISASNSFIKTLKKEVESGNKCEFAREKIITIENAFCFKLSYYSWYQYWFGQCVAVLAFVYGIYLCSSFRTIDPKFNPAGVKLEPGPNDTPRNSEEPAEDNENLVQPIDAPSLAGGSDYRSMRDS